MTDVTLSYKGQTIGELNDSGNKTLKTAGKYCEADIELYYAKPSGAPSYPELPRDYQELLYLTADTSYPRINTGSFNLQTSDAVTFIFRGEGVMIGKRDNGWNVNAGTTTQLMNLYNCTKLFASWEQITQAAGDFASICVTGAAGAFDYGQWGTDYHYTGDLGVLTVLRANQTVKGNSVETLYSAPAYAMALIPCYRKSDDVNGFYDTVNDVFYTAVSGTFVRGPEVGNAIHYNNM
ncbi:MAG: hypothetical protein IIY94_06200 [Oscillospiraceae bacterium]|nr:hypothetical protein [Oscillospiraceae bacterium]